MWSVKVWGVKVWVVIALFVLPPSPACSIAEVGGKKGKANPNATKLLGLIITPSSLAWLAAEKEKRRLLWLVILEP